MNIFLKKKKAKGEKKLERYQSFCEKEKEKRHHYYQERKPKLPESTMKLPEYRKNYYLTHKK